MWVYMFTYESNCANFLRAIHLKNSFDESGSPGLLKTFMSAEIFVSYSSRDRHRVMPLVEAMRSSGLSIWIDEGNIHAADLWSEQIVQAIASAHILIVMLSKHSTDSHNVVKEVMLASEQHKVILPVYLEPSEIPPRLQYQLAGIQHIEFFNQDADLVITNVATILNKRGISNQVHGAASLKNSSSSTQTRSTATPKSRPLFFSMISAAAIAALVWFSWKSPSGESGRPSRLKSADAPPSSVHHSSDKFHLKIPVPKAYPLTKPSEMPFGNPLRLIELSSDGRKLIVTCTVSGDRYFCLRELSKDAFVFLEETKGGFLPFFDPSGESIAFFMDDKLIKLNLKDRVMKTLCETRNPSGGVWLENGIIYFTEGEGFILSKVSDDGGEPEKVPWNGTGGFFAHRANSGKGIVFMGNSPIEWKQLHSIYLPLDTNPSNYIDLSDNTHPTWIGEDQLVTLEDNYLQLQNINPETMQLQGQARTILGAKIRGGRGYYAQYTLAQNGTLAFIEGSQMNQASLISLKPGELPEKLHEDTSFFGTFKISPDGNSIAIEDWGGRVHQIKIYDARRRQFSSITSPGPNYAPVWDPSGEYIYYTSTREEALGVYRYHLQSGEEKFLPIEEDFVDIWINEITADRSHLIMTAKLHETMADFYAIELNGDYEIKQLTKTTWTEWGLTFSPDNHWVVYSSERDMKRGYEIYINRYPQMDQEIRLSESGGEEPDWLPDGTGIYYRNESQWIKLSLDLSGIQPQVTNRELFFQGDYVNVWGPSHDIFPNGDILLLQLEAWEQPDEIDVIINALAVD